MANKVIAKAGVANALYSKAEDHIIAVSEDVFDEGLQKYQSEINATATSAIFDVSSFNSGATYSGLTSALAAVPDTYKAPGMSIKFINSETTEYGVYTYKATTTGSTVFNDEDNWTPAIFVDNDGQEAVVPEFDAESESLHITSGQTLSQEQKNNALKALGIVNSNGVLDVSAQNNGTSYSGLTAAIAAIPETMRKGGMEIKFMNSTTGEYSFYTYLVSSTSVADFTNTDNWSAAVSAEDASADAVVPGFNAQSDTLHITSGQTLTSTQKANALKALGLGNGTVDTVPTSGSTNLVESGGVFKYIADNTGAFDITAYNNGATYSGLTQALNAVPSQFRKGGMSVRYVPTSDNKYVSYRLMATSFSTTESDWQKQGAEVIVSQNTSAGTDGNGNISINGTEVGNFAGAEKLIKLVAIVSSQSSLNVGDIYYNSAQKKIRQKTGDSAYREIPLYNGAIYTYNNLLYTWNGTDLVPYVKFDTGRLNINSVPTAIIEDTFLIVNAIAFHPSAYTDKETARGAIASDLRKNGLTITYLLEDGWHTEQFIGSSITGTSWTTDKNWLDLTKELKEILPSFAIQKTIDVEQGSLNDSIAFDATNRIRSAGFIEASGTLNLSSKVGYGYRVYEYSGNSYSNFIKKTLKDTGGDLSLSLNASTTHIKYVFLKSDDSNVTPADFKYWEFYINGIEQSDYNWTSVSKEYVDGKFDVKDKFLNGKKVVFIGDSITYGGQGSGVQQVTSDKVYHKIFANLSGCENVNKGVTGTCIADNTYTHGTEFVKRATSANLAGTDYVVIFGGTNDFTYDDKAIGDLFNEETITPDGYIGSKRKVATTDLETFSGALHNLINTIRTNAPLIKIAFITPLNRRNYGEGRPSSSETNRWGNWLDDFRDAIIKICAFYSIPVFDLGHCSQLDATNSAINTAYFVDGLHPNASGHKIIGTLLYDWFKANMMYE